MTTKTNWERRVFDLSVYRDGRPMIPAREATALLCEFAEEVAAVIKAHDSTKCECFDCLKTVADGVLDMLPPKKEG